MATEKLQILLDADWRGKSEIQNANKDISKLDDSTGKAQIGFANFAKGAAIAGAAIAGVGVAAKAAWDALGEGAALARSRDQFDRLTESINSTSDSMLSRLREATQGMISDAELIASAGQIISLGLAEGEDGVVRLANLVTQLGWDMQQVILTFANNSKARLDSLGLSIEDVEMRMADLVMSGMNADQAFDLAVIEAGEAKLKLLGSAAGTTAGKMEMLRADFENANNAFKESFANELAEELDSAAGSADNLSSSMINLANVGGAALGSLIGLAADFGADLQGLANAMRMVTGGQAIEFFKFSTAFAKGGGDPGSFYQQLTERQAGGGRRGGGAGRAAATAIPIVEKLSIAEDKLAVSTLAANNEIVQARLRAEEAAAAEDALASSVGSVGFAAESAADKMAQLAAETGNFFDQARRSEDFDPAEVFYQSALAAGASAQQLQQLLVGTGLETPERAQEIYNESIQRQLAAQAGQAFAGGDNFDMLWQGIQAGMANPELAAQQVSNVTNVGGVSVSVTINGNITGEDLDMTIDNAISKAQQQAGPAGGN